MRKYLFVLFLSTIFLFSVPLLANNIRVPSFHVTTQGQIRFYLMGLGAKYFIEWLSKSALADPRVEAAMEKKIPPEFIKREPDANTRDIMARILETELLTYLSTFLSLALTKLDSPNLNRLITSFDAGTQIPMVVSFLKGLWNIAQQAGKSIAQIGIQGSYATLDNIRMTWNSFLDIVKATQSLNADLSYPIRTYHGTALWCGPADPHCLSMQEKSSYEKTLKTLQTNPDQAALYLTQLLANASIVSIGLSLALISYQIGTTVASLLVSDVLSKDLDKNLRTIIERVLRRFVDQQIVYEIGDWIIDFIKKSELVDPKTLTIKSIPDAKKALYTSEFAPAHYYALLPLQKKFFKTLTS